MAETAVEIVIDIDALRAAHALMQQKFQRILQYYVEDTKLYMQSIFDGIRMQDVAMIIPAAHTIKSSSKQLGAEKLALAAFDLESYARESLGDKINFDEISVKAKKMDDLHKTTVLQLEVAAKELFG